MPKTERVHVRKPQVTEITPDPVIRNYQYGGLLCLGVVKGEGQRCRSARIHAALVGWGFTANHRYNVGREIWSVLQMSAMTMPLSAWSFRAV